MQSNNQLGRPYLNDGDDKTATEDEDAEDCRGDAGNVLHTEDAVVLKLHDTQGREDVGHGSSVQHSL